jgi:mono/diheme cytochrome c family protein
MLLNRITASAMLFVFVAWLQEAPGDEKNSLPKPLAAPVDYDKDVAPIFQKHCGKCHGSSKQEGQLRIDKRAVLLRGGESGEPAIVPGNSAQSLLVRAIAGLDSNVEMPPEGPRVSKKQIAIIRAWIDQGAKMGDDVGVEKLTTDQWSFQPLAKFDGKQLSIDYCIARQLDKKALTTTPRAAKRTLIRRLYQVMHGLPPTVADVDKFLNDSNKNAWEKLVERVLNSPRYGERFARHWLDLVRFGETTGFEVNRERVNAWPYRDYVIDAFNSDKPYDQFVREQIAGDALGADVGTGFLVAGPYDSVKSQDINLTLMQRQDELGDIINTTGTAFMGLTLGCARCHNHKFDPITQRDYYSIQAVFAGVNHGERTLSLSPERKAKIDELDNRIATLTQQLAQFISKPTKPPLRAAVNALKNDEQFAPVPARFVRFTVSSTNSSQPCIDELEVWAGKKNVALAANGTKPTASSELPGYPIHKIVHINDGKLGNSHSWISNEPAKGWIQLEFKHVETVDRIVWARDRLGRYKDRIATSYVIEAAVKLGEWKTIASSKDRAVFNAKPVPITYSFEGIPAKRAAQGRAWLSELTDAKGKRQLVNQSQRVYAGVFSQPGPIHRLYRGDPLAKREEVKPDSLEVIGSINLTTKSPEQSRRVAFANWLTDPEHPLVARVIVNRLWQYQFGTGLVDTPSDFGANGTKPTHPELLDWLARQLIENKWSLKHVQRLILLSSTWQQDSAPNAKSLAVDADARMLWRFPPRRLEAEAIRDSVLLTAGVLDTKMGGPGFSGFEVQMENVRHYFPKTKFDKRDFRRMIYMTKVRQEQESVFGAFDCPDASQVMPKRSRSTTPLQALNLLNSEFMLLQADLLAKRLEKDAASIQDQVRLAYSLCFSRPATDQEVREASDFSGKYGLTQLTRALLNCNEFLFIQ